MKQFIIKQGELKTYCGEDSIVKIPEEVQCISHRVFYNKKFNKIILPKNLKEIQSLAFEKCSIKEIIIPDGVTTIGNHAFVNCDDLEYVSIPNSVKEIGNYAFSSCKKLKNVKLPAKLEKFGYRVFDNSEQIILTDEDLNIICGRLLRCNLNEELISIPNNIISIESNSIKNKNNLKVLYLAKSVECIDSDSIIDCCSLEIIKTSNRNISIGKHAFTNCPKLQGIEFID